MKSCQQHIAQSEESAHEHTAFSFETNQKTERKFSSDADKRVERSSLCNMLKRSTRLSKDLFSEIMKVGRALHSENVWLKYRKTGDSIGRFSVSTPKKVSKKAVVRNRARRRVYSVIKPVKGIEGIFFVKNDLEAVPFPKLNEEVASLLAKASLQ